MPVYEYTALDKRGKTIAGIIDTESSVSARQKLRATNIYPVTIREVYATAAPKGSRLASIEQVLSRVRPAELTIMTRQLSTLIGAGFPLVTALSSLIPHTKSKALKQTLSSIKDAIEAGSSFADALDRYPHIFSPIYINMVRAGESSGTLEIILNRLAEINENSQTFRNRIKSSLAYPVLMTIVGTAVLFALLTFVVPNITAMFSEMNKVLPRPTRILIGVSDFLKSYWWLPAFFLAALVIGFKAARRNPGGRRRLDGLMLKTPGVGQILIKITVARFARTLGSLLENGVSMMPALGIVKNVVGNDVMAEIIDHTAEEVEKGHGLYTGLAASDLFPHIAIQMIQVGEQSGELENMLAKIADVFENEVETTLAGLMSLLDPIIILIMGVVFGSIILAILLPIMEMNQLIR